MATFDSSPLDPLEAYEAVMQFAARRGPSALRLALHASMPQVLRPELLHQLRINFVPESLNDLAVEADVLFAAFCLDLGNGYYQFDAAARRLLLQELDPTYRHLPGLRSQRVASFLSVYIDHELRAAAAIDALHRDYLEVEAWVAFAFLDPDAAAEQLARAVEGQLEPGRVAARARIGGVAGALTIPLARHRDVVTYAEAVDALDGGDVERGRTLMRALGDREVRVGGVTLPAPPATLKAKQVAAPEPVTATGETARGKDADQERLAPQVFLSYALQPFERECASELAYYLEQLGLRVWRRETQTFEPGRPIEETTQKAIQESAAAVVLAERVYLDDDVALWELQKIRGQFIGERGLRAFWIATTGRMPNSEEVLSLERLIPSEQPLSEVPAAQRSVMVRDAAILIALACGVHAGNVPQSRPWPGTETPPARMTSATVDVVISCANADVPAAERLVKSFVEYDEIGAAEVLPVTDPRGYGLQLLQRAGAFIQLVSSNWPQVPLWRRPFEGSGPNQIIENVSTALERGIFVVPVLVGDMQMPREDAFPEPIRPLARRQAVSLRKDRWDDDVAVLIRSLTRRVRVGASGVSDSADASLRVFIGFANPDRALAGRVSEGLAARGIGRWSFDQDIPAGAHFENAIAVALRQCDVLLLILTEAATRSEWVLRELELASQFNKGIVPVVIGEATFPERMNSLLAGIVRIQMSSTPGANVLDRIAGSIRDVAKSSDTAASSEPRSRESSSRPVPQVFLSYEQAETGVADLIGNGLRNRGVETFMSSRGLTGGMQWRRAIAEALEHCDAVIRIVTPASSGPGETWETDQVRATGKPVFRVLVGDSSWSNRLRAIIGGAQGIRISRKPTAADLDRIATAVHEVMARQSSGTPPESEGESPSAGGHRGVGEFKASLRVYLSSTLSDLEQERAAVKNMLIAEAIVKESYIAQEADLRESSVQDVSECDLYIAILGLRYGFIPPDETKSITQLEYEAAGRANVPRLVFIKEEDAISVAMTDAHTGEHPPQLIDHFRREVLTGRDGPRPAMFRTLEELMVGVRKAVTDFNARVTTRSSRPSPPRTTDDGSASNATSDPRTTVHTLLFVGHTIDRRDRTAPRFPPASEGIAVAAIRDVLRRELDRTEGQLHGIASGSDGGDILFHEGCLQHRVPSTMYLPLPAEEFARQFLAPAGDDWVLRFQRLTQSVNVIVNRLEPGAYDVPQTSQATPSYRSDPWYANARAMFDAAVTRGAEHATLIALWDNGWGGPGGPSDLVERATERGVNVVVLDTRTLFGLAGDTPPGEIPR